MYLIFGMSLAKMDSMGMNDEHIFTVHKYPNIKVILFLFTGRWRCVHCFLKEKLDNML